MKRTTSRTCFLYISDKKGTFHFSDKIHIKRNFLKKGTKWQSLVNSRSCRPLGGFGLVSKIGQISMKIWPFLPFSCHEWQVKGPEEVFY